MKKLYPTTPLGLICRKGLGSTIRRLGIVDHVWEIQKGERETYKKVLSELKNFQIEILTSAHTSVRTTLFCAQIKAKTKITFQKPWNHFLFDERIKWPASYPESLRLLSLLTNHSEELRNLFAQLGPGLQFIEKNRNGKLQAPPEWADPQNGWRLPEELSKSRAELLERYGLRGKKWIALFPGSVWATKMWRASGFQELGIELQKKGYQIVVMGGPEEKALGETVAKAIPEAISLCGQTSILESLLILSGTNLVVGNDSSSSHMAALMGVPVVSLYGPTVLKFGYRPWAAQSAVAEIEGMACRPCGPHGHKQCPLGHHNCMQKLATTEVLKVVESMLSPPVKT